ncbi:MAG: SigE family RNA polymerase sigma factor [Nitrososphaerales archaeon]
MGEGALVAVRIRCEPPPAVTDRRDAAVAALFDAHYATLCRLAAFLLDDPGQAEEAVQDAFLRTFVGWRRLRHPDHAPAYLRAAVVNQCRSRRRRRTTEQRGNRAVFAGAMDERGVSDVERTGDVLAVLEAVRGLPARQREAVVLRYYADLSEQEVARGLGCSVGTVKSQLSKARATLARLLEGEVTGPAEPVTGAVSDE